MAKLPKGWLSPAVAYGRRGRIRPPNKVVPAKGHSDNSTKDHASAWSLIGGDNLALTRQ